MEVGALLLSGPNPESSGILGVPTALLPVVGAPIVKHLADQLAAEGVRRVKVVISCIGSAQETAAEDARRTLGGDVTWRQTSREQFWASAYSAYITLKESGCERILVVRLGGYLELSLPALIAFHKRSGNRLTRFYKDREPLDAFLVSASDQEGAALLFSADFGGLENQICPSIYNVPGYVNPLANIFDLRQIFTDIFAWRTLTKPRGKELRPGIWIGEGAKINRGARLVAPVFIGAHSRVRASAVITRGSSLEHHTEVDCGTVIENSTVLPYSYVGAGLEVMHSVVGDKSIANLKRKIVLRVEDPKLLNAITPSAGLRALLSAGALAAYLPTQFFRGFLPKPPAADCLVAGDKTGALQPFGIDTGISSTVPAIAEKSASNDLVTARTHGQ